MKSILWMILFLSIGCVSVQSITPTPTPTELKSVGCMTDSECEGIDSY